MWNEIALQICNSSSFSSFERLHKTLFLMCLPLAPWYHFPPATVRNSDLDHTTDYVCVINANIKLTTTTTTTFLRPYVKHYQGESTLETTFANSHQPSFISFISFVHLLQSIASSLFNLCGQQSICTTSLQVLFGLPLGMEPSTSC